MVDDTLSSSNAAGSRGLPALDAYRGLIELDLPFHPAAPPAPAEELPGLARQALDLLADDPAVERLGGLDVPGGNARHALAALLTVRPPGPLPPDAIPVLDALLGGEREQRPLVEIAGLPPISEAFDATSYAAADATALWQGDIRTLDADAIVNAANSTLLGCFVPGHACIDNAIHAAAGPRLREDCNVVARAKGAPAAVGSAEITRGYQLPARYVLHTVGPVVAGRADEEHERALAAAYRSCLDLAASVEGIRTVAFCAISTGVFGYPKEAAAPVALRTVAEWLDRHPDRLDRVVFDVFSTSDYAAYAAGL